MISHAILIISHSMYVHALFNCIIVTLYLLYTQVINPYSFFNSIVISIMLDYVIQLFLLICTLYAENECFGGLAQDVVFVIDESGSIGSIRFQLIREFIANITTELIHYSPNSAVGVILYNNNAHIYFNLLTYTSLNALLSAINNLPYSGGGTNTAEALTLLLSTAQDGTLGLRSNSSKVAIVITDGRSNSQSATLSAAAALHAANIFDVYAVGVDGVDLTELEGIASSIELVFFTNSFNNNGLEQLLDRILPQLCISKYITYINMYMYVCTMHKAS